jgi:ELWxxDGT repeat protein
VQQLEDRNLLSSPQLLLDINPGAGSSNPARMLVIGSEAYFTANDGTHGNALWKTDGTAAGTVMVADLTPWNLTNVNGELFFSVDNGPNDQQLWKSDGTTAGTVMLADAYSRLDGNPVDGYFGYGFRELTNVNGTLYFRADDGTHGGELWKSDGTAAGTVMVKDINPGALGSYPNDLTNVNGTLYFAADDGIHGFELWRSDGSPSGTALVKDLNPGSGWGLRSGYFQLANFNGTLYFGATGGAGGLWKSDGTAAGTVQVKNGLSSIFSFTNVDGTLYFSANDGVHGGELWKSDGTAAGTVLVKDINSFYDSYGAGYGSYPADLTNVNGTLYFNADDRTHGRELWKSDGTTAGTALVKDILPGASITGFGYSGGATGLTNVNGTLYFSAYDGIHGSELWQSDGTAAGTTLVQDINPGPNGSTPYYLTNLNGTLLFAANDGVHGNELWELAPAASTLTLSPTSLPPATVGDSYAPVTITATGGSGSYTFALASGSNLPAGLTLSTAGVLSGKPTTAGGSPFSFTITATDNSNPDLTGSQAYTLTVDPAIRVGPASLPVATVADAANDQLTVTGGSGTGYSFALASGSSLPAELTLGSTGAITGTPSQSGTYTFTIVATDSLGATGSRVYRWTVDPAVIVQPPVTIPIATVGDRYATDVQFTASGGSDSGYTFKAKGLPAGMTITSTGSLSGTPTRAGIYTITVTATDSKKGTASVTAQLTVDPRIVLSPGTLPVATIGDSYSKKLTATGGSGLGYSFALASGSSLPPGLVLSGDTLSGNVTTAGSYTFTIVATDSLGATGSRTYTMVVDPAITISPSTLPAATIGQEYTETLSASGGSGTGYTFKARGLPSWLTLSSAGTLSGTPPSGAPAQITFTVIVTDNEKGTDTMQYTLTIND